MTSTTSTLLLSSYKTASASVLLTADIFDSDPGHLG